MEKDKCVKCGICFRHCPYHAITMSADIKDGFPVFHTDWCYLCGLCFNKCPKEAVQIQLARTHELQRHRTTTGGVDDATLEKKGFVPKQIPPLPELFERLKE